MSEKTTVRVGHLDVMHSRSRVTAIIGPVELPPAAVVEGRLAAIAAVGPRARLGLQPSTHTNRWVFDPVAHRPTVTTMRAPDSPMDLLEVPAADGCTATTGPTSIVLAGEYLRTDHNHGLGEVSLGLLLHGVILGSIDPSDPTAWSGALQRGNGIAAAAVRTFGSDPRRLWALRESLHRRPAPNPTTTGPTVPWAPQRTAAFSRMSPGTVSRLREWRDAHAPGISMFAVVAAALHRGLAWAGTALDEVATVTLDVRRYLADGHCPLGNFVSGIEFDLGSAPSPQRVHHLVAEALASGRPVANLALNSLRTRIGLRGGAPPVPLSRPTSPRARLLFASLGSVPRRGAIPWLGTADPFYLVHNDPAGPEGITVSWGSIGGSMLVMTSFHGNVFDRARVQRGLDLVVADPVGLLARPGSATPSTLNIG